MWGFFIFQHYGTTSQAMENSSEEMTEETPESKSPMTNDALDDERPETELNMRSAIVSFGGKGDVKRRFVPKKSAKLSKLVEIRML